MRKTWIPVTALPPVETDPIGPISSGPVLVFRKLGRQCVARYETWDHDFPEFRWVTDCSEGWDISKEVIYWQPLPEAPGIEKPRGFKWLIIKLRCWWLGCEQHEQDPSPANEARCQHCNELVSYGDMVGDTRYRRSMTFLDQFSPRRLWPKKCSDCGHRFKCDENTPHIPF